MSNVLVLHFYSEQDKLLVSKQQKESVKSEKNSAGVDKEIVKDIYYYRQESDLVVL